MTTPTYDDLIEPLFVAIKTLGGSASIEEQEEKVAEILNLSEGALSEIHKGNKTKFSYRLAWARTYLKRFGVLTNSSRGVWALTPNGQKTEMVNVNVVKRFVQNLDRKKKNEITENDKEPEEYETHGWQDQVLKYIKNMSPDGFERLCQRILRESGFIHVEVTGRSGDGGIDGKGVVRIGGLLSFHVIFQSKRYQGSISPSIVRDFRGAMVGRADKGLLITTGTFTRDARKEAQRDGAPPLDLIDGENLVEKLKELGIGIKIEEKIIEEISVDENFFKNL